MKVYEYNVSWDEFEKICLKSVAENTGFIFRSTYAGSRITQFTTLFLKLEVLFPKHVNTYCPEYTC